MSRATLTNGQSPQCADPRTFADARPPAPLTAFAETRRSSRAGRRRRIPTSPKSPVNSPWRIRCGTFVLVLDLLSELRIERRGSAPHPFIRNPEPLACLLQVGVRARQPVCNLAQLARYLHRAVTELESEA